MSLDKIFAPAQPGDEDYGDTTTSLDHIFGMAPGSSAGWSSDYAPKPSSHIDFGDIGKGLTQTAPPGPPPDVFGPIGEAALHYEDVQQRKNPDFGQILGGLGGIAGSLLGTPGRAIDWLAKSNIPVASGAAQAVGTAFSPASAAPGVLTLGTSKLSQLFGGGSIPQAEEGFAQNYKTYGGDQPAPYDLPALFRGLGGSAQETGAGLGSIAQNPKASGPERVLGAAGSVGLEALPYAIPAPPIGRGLKLIRGTEDVRPNVVNTTARVRQVPAAIEAPPVRAALPSGPYADPFLEADRQAAMTRPQQVQDRLARQTPGESGPAIPQAAPAPNAPIAMSDLRPRAPLTVDEIRAIPSDNPAPMDVRYGAAQDAFRAGQDPRAAVAAADARWQGLKSDIGSAQDRALATRAGNPPESGTLPARGGLTGRGITTTPIGREDLTLRGARFAPPGAGEVAPISREDLRARIGAPLGEGNVPFNADELSRRIGATTPSEARAARTFADTGPAQMAAKDAFAREVEARQAQVKGPIAESGMAGPLVGRAFGKGGTQLERAGRTGITAADLSASLERQSKVHQANEAFIAAMKSGDFAAAERAVRDVNLLGGDLNHTSARAKAAGVSAPSGAEMRKWLKASGGTNEVPAKAPSVPSGGGGLLNRLGTFTKEDIGGGPLPGDKGRYGTPEEVRAARLAGTSPSGNSRIPLDDTHNFGRGNPPTSKFRLAEQAVGVGKTLTTAASPFHFMGRHALPFMTSHPVAWVKGSAKGLGEGFSMNPAQLDARITQMRSNLEANGVGNLYLGKPHLGMVGGEESVATNFANKFGPLGTIISRSGQGFTQGLNEVRYMAVQGAINTSVALAKKGLAQPLTLADRRGIADTINHFSGRGFTLKAGEVGAKASIARAANITTFSPQLAVARVRMFADGAKGFADILNNLRQGKAPNPVAIERARLAAGAVTGMGALYMLMQAAGGKPDLSNPVSSTFGNVDIGAPGPAQAAASLAATETGMGTQAFPGKNVSINPTESESTLVRNVARFMVALYDQATGQKNLQKMEGTKLEATPMDVATRTLLGQIFTSPVAYPIAQFLQGFPVTPSDAVTPMVVGSTLRGAGVQPPTIGGKAPAAPKPAPGAAPTKKATPGVPKPRPTDAPTSTPPDGNSDSGREYPFMASNDLMSRALPAFPPAVQQAFANRKIERPANIPESVYGRPSSGGGYYDPSNGQITLGRNNANAYGNQMVDVGGAQHEILHAVAAEDPYFSREDQAGYPVLRRELNASLATLAANPQTAKVAAEAQQKFADNDPGHAFTVLGTAYLNELPLPPQIRAYFDRMKAFGSPTRTTGLS